MKIKHSLKLVSELKLIHFQNENSISELQFKIREAVLHIDSLNPNERGVTGILFTNSDALTGNPKDDHFEDVKQSAIDLLKKYS